MPFRALGFRGRIGNRVKFPSGTAAVSAIRPRSSTKVGHWETGKAERAHWRCLRKRKPEELLEMDLRSDMGRGLIMITQENGCDDHQDCHSCLFFLKRKSFLLSFSPQGTPAGDIGPSPAGVQIICDIRFLPIRAYTATLQLRPFNLYRLLFDIDSPVTRPGGFATSARANCIM